MSVETIFAAAAQKPASDRAAFLEEACAADPELRLKVERLLKAHDAAGEFLESPAHRPVGTIDFTPIAERVGTKIGPYILREQIGEGGFGLVFVAEQQEPVKRKVALKVIKPGMDSQQVVARFEAERQALALMDHPNIAKVLDAGATESGRPYFVMELVRGIPITEYCDQNQLSPRERLDLFVTVCQAIQHAHQKGIIHRDIKPSNVLVTSHDGNPVAKVIDFGVAKAIHQHLTERTIYTNFAQMIGTPLYMSPEQAEMSGLDIDTRSDIYSLGVLLYELLTGTTPLEKKQLREAAYDEFRRLIRDEEPPKPSTRLSTSESIASVAAQRKTEPAKLSKLMRGDLDWITMKALEKDRTRRYETANGLARDIQRYLSDEPVEACPPSASYRLRKFAKKNRTAIGVASAFAVTLFIFTVLSLQFAVLCLKAENEAKAERNRAVAAETDAREQAHQAAEATAAERAAVTVADAERAKARKQADIAQAVQKFLEEDLLDQADVSRAAAKGSKPDPEIKLKTAIDRAAGKIPERFTGQPLTEASVRATIGRAYVSLGLYHEARPHLERARILCQIEMARNTVSEADAAVLSATLNHTSIELAMVEAVQGHFEDAARILRESKGNLGSRWAAKFMDMLAGKNAAPELIAVLQLQQIAEMIVAFIPSLQPQAAELRDRRRLMGLTNQSRFAEAEELLHQMIDRRRQFAKPDYQLFVLMSRLGDVQVERGKLTEAKATLAAASDGYKEILGEAHPLTAAANCMLGEVLLKIGEFEPAEAIFRSALTTTQSQLMDGLPTLQIQSALGAALAGQKKYSEADRTLRTAFEGIKAHPWVKTQWGKSLLAETADRLVRLNEMAGNSEEAAKWRKELEALKPPAKP